MNKTLLSMALALSSAFLVGCESTQFNDVETPKIDEDIAYQTIHVTRWGDNPNWNEEELNCANGRTPIPLKTKREKNGRNTRIYECVLETTLEPKNQVNSAS